ncbi:CPXCG motif-containing cysteine-rich protein [Spongiibacter marinus]|uniref:CPXCG motif-containing cysteine-rich protein n=1 Tax=Spongiibacter marinus TaxID=354246 RepID=UPI003564863A
MLESWKDYCPYCGERIELLIDPSLAGEPYVEDCEVCCRPMRVSVSDGDTSLGADSWAQAIEALPASASDSGLQVQLQREDEV